MRYPAIVEQRSGANPPTLGVAADTIRAALATGEPSGLLLDFDGTLAPIVRDPTQARARPDVRAALGHLATRYRVVGVISGRDLNDLAVRASAPGVWLVGSHGAVIRAPDGRDEPSTVSDDLVERLHHLSVDLADLAGVRREPKGTAVAFHYRGLEDDHDLVAELRRRVTAAANAAGLATGEGRCVIEARVPGINKGVALRQIVQSAGLTRVVVVGDDWTDLDAFRAAHEHETCHGIAIAVRSPELPGPLRQEADVIADGVTEITQWLISLAYY